ncbi:hypothetical protein [Sorangium sp. So ce1335]|uniref:hypothetical protein n=1 Tax=Sorangium sp. So ce1335 TaxID=3133335 RepID=UPI003F62AE31
MMKKTTLFTAAFALAFGMAAASEGLAWTKIRRYSAFNCYGSAPAADANDGKGLMDLANGGKIYCPHASSELFPLDEVEGVQVSINNYVTSSPSNTVGYVKACVSWSYTESGVSSFGADCSDEKEFSYGTAGGQTVALQEDSYLDRPGELQTWSSRPFGYAYLVINSGYTSGTGYHSTVTGYKVFD